MSSPVCRISAVINRCWWQNFQTFLTHHFLWWKIQVQECCCTCYGFDYWWWGRFREHVVSRSTTCRHHFPLCFPCVICVALSFVGGGRKNRLAQMYQRTRILTMVKITSHRHLAVHRLCLKEGNGPLPSFRHSRCRAKVLWRNKSGTIDKVCHVVNFCSRYKVERWETVDNRRNS
jgi:hypothetical protein